MTVRAPVSFFRMTEPSGSTVADYIGANAGTATGTTVVSGIRDNARSLNGTTDKVTIANAANFAGWNKISISFWFKWSNLTAVNQEILSKFTSITDAEWYFNLLGDGFAHTLTFICRASLTSNATFTTGTWYHIVAMADLTLGSNNVWLYVNGSLDNTGSAASGALPSGSTPVKFGGVDNGNGYTGALDEVGLWNLILTSGEIGELYNSGVALDVTTTTPTAPTLSSPANGATGVPADPTLEWNAVAGALTYHLQVSTDNTFATTDYDASGLTPTSQLVTGLSTTTLYYWRVTAFNGWGTSAWSSVWSFTTTNLVAPTLSSPANGAFNQATPLTLSWGAVGGALNYTLQVATDAAFVNTVYENNILTATSQSVPFSLNTRYYWRVYASNAGGQSAWSGVWSFLTLTNVPAPDAQLFLTWTINVNWNGDGSTFVDESSHLLRVESIRRGRQNYISASGNGFEPLPIGAASFIFDNSDGRYDPWNTASALYPNVTPGKFIAVTVTYNSVTYDVFAGTLEDIVPLNQDRVPEARITAVDGAAWLRQNTSVFAAVTLGGPANGISYAISLVLLNPEVSGGAYPTVWGTNLDATSEFLQWYGDGSDMLTQIQKLTDANGGWFYIAADGKATFKSYQNLNSGAIAATIDQSQIYKVIPIGQPWDNLRNAVRVTSYAAATISGVTLWTLNQAPLYASGQTVIYYAELSDPYVGNKVATFKLTQNADGSGADYSAQLTTATSVAGKSAKVTVTNNGPNAGYLFTAKIDGDCWRFTSANSLQDNSGGSLYGTRTLTINSPWQNDAVNAQTLADNLANQLYTPRPFPEVTLEARYDLQFAHDLSALLRLSVAAKNIRGFFRILGVTHRQVGETVQAMQTTWQLCPIAGDNMAVFGGNTHATVASGTTVYYGNGNGTFSTDATARIPLSAGIVRNLRLDTSGAQPGTGSLVTTLFVEGAAPAGAVTITIAAGATPGSVADTTHAVTITAGQRVSFQIVNNASSASLTINGLSWEFVPSNI